MRHDFCKGSKVSNMEQWQIERGSGVCAGSGRELEAGEEYYGALLETDEGFVRKDYSIEYWQEHKDELDVYCFWKTRVPLPNQKKKIFVDDAILINFFERLAREQDQTKLNFRFVLALILMRKRLLKYDDTVRHQGREIWRMHFVRSKDVHEVENPHLNEEEIQQVSEQLGEILQGELYT